MTTDFIQTSVNKSAVRTYTNPLASVDEFSTVMTSFESDSTMAITEKTLKKEVLKIPIGYFNEIGELKGTITVSADSIASYNDASAAIIADAAIKEDMAGPAGTNTKLEDDASWYVQFSCLRGEDTFTVSISREKITVSNYADDATLAAIETWADTLEVLG